MIILGIDLGQLRIPAKNMWEEGKEGFWKEFSSKNRGLEGILD